MCVPISIFSLLLTSMKLDYRKERKVWNMDCFALQEMVWLGGMSARAYGFTTLADSRHHQLGRGFRHLVVFGHPAERAQAESDQDQEDVHEHRER